MALSGIARHTLSADIFLDGEGFSAGAECILTDSEEKFKFPKFYIYQRRKVGNVLTISAIDRLVMAGQPFDCTGLASVDGGTNSDGEEVEKVLVSNVLSKLAAQCGFSAVSYDGGKIESLPLAYFKGKGCEDILSGLSALFCGFWCTDSRNRLVMKRWCLADGAASVSAASDVDLSSEKGGIERVVATDSITGDVFDTLGSTDFQKTLRVSAEYMTKEQADSILSAFKGKLYYGWSCKAELSAMAEVGFTFDDKFIGEITFYPHFNGLGAEFGAPDISETEWDYYGEVTKALNKKLGIGVEYGDVSVDADGIVLHGRYD